MTPQHWVAGGLDWLWRASWQAAVLVALVLLVQRVLGKRLSARWHYNLWLVVLVRLALPMMPSSSWSIYNLLPSRGHEVAMAIQPQQAEAAQATAPAPARQTVLPTLHAPPATVVTKPSQAAGKAPWQINWSLMIAAAWALGATLLSLRIAIATWRLQRAIGKSSEVTDEFVLDLLAQAQREMGINRRVRIVATSLVDSPALMGVFRPRLLLPANLLHTFNPAELRLIFLHELAHLKRNDILVNWISTALLVVHWFNPVVWVAMARMRSDRELACDEMVLTRSQQDRRAYGHTILKLLTSLSSRRFAGPAQVARAAGAVGIVEGGKSTKRRIAMIVTFQKRQKGWAVLAAGAMLAIGCVALTDSKDDPKSPAPTPQSANEPASTPGPQTPEDPFVRPQKAVGPAQVRNERAAADEAEIADLRAQLAKAYAKVKAHELTVQKHLSTKPANVADAQLEKARQQEAMAEAQLLESRLADLMAKNAELGKIPSGTTVAKAVKFLNFTTQPAHFRMMTKPMAYGIGKSKGAVEEMLDKLQQRLPEVSMDAMPFSECIVWIREVTGLNIVVNEKALEAAGMDNNSPVKLKLKDVTVEQVLRHIARQLGGDSVRLGFGIDGNMITFSTEDELARYGVIRAYDVQDLVAKAATQPSVQGQQFALESLRDVIMDNVEPDGWAAKGGTFGNISTFGNTLVIKCSFMNHLDIERLLGELRGVRGDMNPMTLNLSGEKLSFEMPRDVLIEAPAAAPMPAVTKVPGPVPTTTRPAAR